MAVKIIPDRTYAHGGLNYGFVEYHEMRAAETALQTLNGRKIFDTEIRVNWAYQNQAAKEDLTHHVSNLVFVMAFQYRILTNVALAKTESSTSLSETSHPTSTTKFSAKLSPPSDRSPTPESCGT